MGLNCKYKRDFQYVLELWVSSLMVIEKILFLIKSLYLQNITILFQFDVYCKYPVKQVG